ncbi:MAG: acyltransferase domain-containing protein [Clostridia bacterium]|nr:acyltransferase domain-containing protein [Clostridia bacterium]
MQTDFLLHLCEKIDLPPEARDTALRALSHWEKPLLRAVRHSDLEHLSACTRRLRLNRKKGAAFCLAFCLLQAEQAYAEYRKRGIPDEIYYDTMRDITVWVNTLQAEENIVGVTEISWLRHTLYLNLFKIGRLQYQFFTTNHLLSGLSPQKDYPIKSGEAVLNIHIPAGGRLALDDCRASLAAARDFFENYYPQYDYKGFVCDSWLLDCHNADFMRPESNIVRFRALFDAVYQTAAPMNEITRRLWGELTVSKSKIAAFPAETDLQKRTKAYLLSGGKTGNGYGFIVK